MNLDNLQFQYFFILGRNPTLSLAEIISVLNLQKRQFFVNNFSQEAAILETEAVLENLNLMNTLGGTIKLGIIKNKIGLDEEETKFEEIFSAEHLLTHFLPKKEGKLHLGISIYNAGGQNQCVASLGDKLKDLNLTVKNNLKEKGKKVGFVKIKERFLSSVSVEKNELLTKGVEIVLLVANEKIYVGKTLAVQEFEKFSFRDIKRPRRDKRSGIMPPKLARMMINLAQIDKREVLLDPFCGSGTVLQEAVMMGYKNIIGSDISQKAISDTRQNLDWLFRHLSQLNKSSHNIEIFQSDIRSISNQLSKNSIDAIITEPYLGPPFYKRPNYLEIKGTFSNIEDLYLSAFRQFAAILKQSGSIIIIFPVFEENGKMFFLEILDKIQSLGFEKNDLVPVNLKSNPVVFLTSRGTIIYGSKNQFIKREIIHLRRRPCL